MTDIQSRKSDHLDLAARGDVGFRQKTNLFECAQLIHDALPECHLDTIDLSCTVLGRRLAAPLLIAGMTGGTERAGQINRDLAALASRKGYAFGLGSQRPMLMDTRAVETYRVRDVAPDVLLLGNLGAVQAVECTRTQLEALVEAVAADALCVHLNPAMEVVQPGGDRDFRGCLPLLQELAKELSVPVIAKETGCGIAAHVAGRLAAAGVEHVDVSGAGGTSWVGVETRRAADEQRGLGELLWDWGIPTAASVLAVQGKFQTVIATGGMTNGVEAAKAIALGANLVGIARPVLQAYDRGGIAAAEQYLTRVELELRSTMLLTGSPTLQQLRRAPRLLRGELRDYEQLWETSGSTPVPASGRHEAAFRFG